MGWKVEYVFYLKGEKAPVLRNDEILKDLKELIEAVDNKDERCPEMLSKVRAKIDEDLVTLSRMREIREPTILPVYQVPADMKQAHRELKEEIGRIQKEDRMRHGQIKTGRGSNKSGNSKSPTESS